MATLTSSDKKERPVSAHFRDNAKRMKTEEEATVPSLMNFALQSTLEQVFQQDPDLLVNHLMAMPELKKRLQDNVLGERFTSSKLRNSDLVEVERLRIESADDPMPHADEWDRTTMRVDQLPFRFREALKIDYRAAVEEWLEVGYCCHDTWTDDGRIQWQLHPWDNFETWENDYMNAVKKTIVNDGVPDHDEFFVDENGVDMDVGEVVPITCAFPHVKENTVLFDAHDYCINDAGQEIRSEFQKDVNTFFWGTAPNEMPNAYKEQPVHQLTKYVHKPKVRLVVTGCCMGKNWRDAVKDNEARRRESRH